MKRASSSPCRADSSRISRVSRVDRPDCSSPNTIRCRSPDGSQVTGRRSSSTPITMPAGGSGRAGRSSGRSVVGSTRTPGSTGPASGPGPARPVAGWRPAGRRCRATVDPGHGGEQVQPVPGQAPAGPVHRHGRRDPRVDVGVQRVAEPQLDPGADEVLERRPDLRPAGGGQRPGAPRSSGRGRRSTSAAPPAVRTTPARRPSRRPPGSRRRTRPGTPGPRSGPGRCAPAPVGDRGHARGGERRLPLGQQPFDRRHGPADQVRLQPAGHHAHLRQAGQRGQ